MVVVTSHGAHRHLSIRLLHPQLSMTRSGSQLTGTLQVSSRIVSTSVGHASSSTRTMATLSKRRSTWRAPAAHFPALDSSSRVRIGYPAADGLIAPAARRVDTQWPGVAVSQTGVVYMSAYAADTVSPWQTCASGPLPPEGRINCT